MVTGAPSSAGNHSGCDAVGSRPLGKSMLYAVSGMGLFHACQFGVIILLRKFAPAEVLGQVLFSLAIATPVIVFCSLELRGALVADAAGEFTFGTYRRLRSLTVMIAGAILLGMVAWQALTEPRLAYIIILAGLCAGKLIVSLAEIGWGLFQKRERLDLMATSAAMRGLGMILPFALLIPLCAWWSGSATATVDQMANSTAFAVVIYVAVSIAILFVFDRRCVAMRPDYDPAWTWRAVGRLARQTFPLGIVLLILHLCNSIPQLVIEHQPNGKAALGYFGALTFVTMAGNLLVFQAANAGANRLAHYYQTDLAAFLRLGGRLLGLALVVGLLLLGGTLLFGEWLLRVLYRPEDAGYYHEFKIIVAAQCLALLTNVFGVLTTQMRLFWLQVPAQVIVLLCTATAAFLFIPSATNLVYGGACTLLVRSGVHVALYGGCVCFGLFMRRRVLAARVSLPADRARIPVVDTGPAFPPDGDSSDTAPRVPDEHRGPADS
ncbi:MAG: hypothetical protein ABIG44_05210 [Planctomycetota bacterium]